MSKKDVSLEFMDIKKEDEIDYEIGGGMKEEEEERKEEDFLKDSLSQRGFAWLFQLEEESELHKSSLM